MRTPKGVDESTSLRATLRRTVDEFREDGMTDWAAALTYYGLLSLFPALIAVASLVGLFTDADTLTDVILDVAPESAADALSGPIESITTNTGAAGVALVLGLAGALWAASGYTSAFGRAGNVIYEVREGRPFWRLRPAQILVTLVNVVLVVFVVIALVLSGPLLRAVADPLGVGDTAITVWSWMKWPLLLAAALILLMVLYAFTPNVRQRSVVRLLPGALVALVVWAIATAGFAFYVANFGSYDRTYGTLGGVVVLLVWLWLTNVALLLGAEFNAEQERSREIDEGMPARREIQLPVRDEPEPPKTH
jgi:membrane protein